MKIAVSATSKIPSTSANSIQVMMAAQGLVQAGQTIRLWAPQNAEPLVWDDLRQQYGLRCEPFAISRVPSCRWLHRLDFSLRAVNEAQRWGADWIYTWTIQIALVAARRGLPVVFEAHDLPTGKYGKRWFAQFLSSHTEKRLAFITDALRRKIQAAYPAFSQTDTLIAPNGINAEDYANLPSAAAAKAEMGFPQQPIASCSGHLYLGRGTELFLQLAAAFPEILFYWFGGKSETVADDQRQARERGLKNVTFTGNLPKAQLPLAQAASDYLLMPYERSIAGSSGGNSADICSPMKLFEYLAAARPILASDLPVLHEVLDDGCAWFCAPEDAASWAAGLKHLIENPEAAQGMAKNAGIKAREYTWEKRARRILNAIEEK